MTDVEKQLRDDLKNANFALHQVEVDERTLLAKKDRIKWKIDYISNVLGLTDPAPRDPDRATLPPTSPKPQAVPLHSYAGMRSSDVVKDVLLRVARPMRVADIVAEALERGYNVDPKRATINFTSALARATYGDNPDSIFRRAGRGLFTLRELLESNDPAQKEAK